MRQRLSQSGVKKATTLSGYGLCILDSGKQTWDSETRAFYTESQNVGLPSACYFKL